jgi:3-oxoacyl-[acyl-carrier protein] reductase
MDLDVQGEPIVIVGGTSGMGFATAEILAAGGARLGLIARDAGRAEAKVKALRAKGGDVEIFLGDGMKPGSVEAAIDKAAQTFGRLYGLAVTAGPMAKIGPFESYEEADWDFYYQACFMLTARACRAALPHIVANGGGAVVTTASYSSRKPVPGLIPYVAMKAAVASLTKSLSQAYGEKKVRVNCVCPGAIATEMLGDAGARALEEFGPPEDTAISRMMKERWQMDVALGRFGRPDELGDLYAFLLSKRAGYLTGATINQDGGTSFF